MLALGRVSIVPEIEHGFIADVYKNWVAYEGTEWGDQMRALHAAYEMSEDYVFDNEDLSQLEKILRRHLEAGREDGWLFGNDPYIDPEFYAQEAGRAKEAYPKILEDWEQRCAWSELRMKDLREAEKLIPEWMKP